MFNLPPELQPPLSFDLVLFANRTVQFWSTRPALTANPVPPPFTSPDFYKSKGNYFRILSQNGRGFTSSSKIEEAINQIDTFNIDIYLLQKTDTKGPYLPSEEFQTHRYTIFLHGSREATNPQQGGVGIIIGPRALKTCRKAGSVPPRTEDTSAESSRFISLDLAFRHNNIIKT